MADSINDQLAELTAAVRIASRDMQFNTGSIGDCIATMRVMDEKLQVVLEACTAEPPESELGDTIKALIAEIERNTVKLGGIEAALDRQTAALGRLLDRPR